MKDWSALYLLGLLETFWDEDIHYAEAARLLRDILARLRYWAEHGLSVLVTLSPPPKPKNYYFDGSIGLYQNADSSNVWIYPTMRRGGRMIYALDVTTPSAPRSLAIRMSSRMTSVSSRRSG